MSRAHPFQPARQPRDARATVWLATFLSWAAAAAASPWDSCARETRSEGFAPEVGGKVTEGLRMVKRKSRIRAAMAAVIMVV